MAPVYDIAIVGAGPVGLTLSILLAQRGWKVGIFDKQPAIYPLPRAVHFDHEVARILQAADVIDDIFDSTEAADVYEWRNATGEILLSIESHALGLSGWPDANMFAQPDLERVLEAEAHAHAEITLQRGCEVVDVMASEASATLEVVSPQGRRTVQARFVVGCDGANSMVRPHLGATVTDLGFFFDWLIVDIVPHEPKVWRPLNIQICDPLRPTTLVSGGRGRRRWEFMRLPGEGLDELNSADTAWRLLAAWGMTPANATLERHTVYRFQARWVDTWRKGRLLLAGDAAHQMPPFAGQGMCSGIRDAANLAWKLDLVLADRAPEALLDTYASERIPHVGAMIQFSMGLGRVICIADAQEAAGRDALMVAAAKAGEAPPAPQAVTIGPGVLLEGDEHAGHLMMQGVVQHGAHIGRFDDVVGRGWVLLGKSADPAAQLEPAMVEFFASLGGITTQLGSGGAVRDVAGDYHRWFERNGVEVVLQRPDFYIFGTATTAAGTNALVEGLHRVLQVSDHTRSAI